MTDEPPLIGLDDLAELVGKDHARKLMLGLHEEEEARKVLEQQEVDAAGRMDRAVDYFYDEECDGRVDMLIPPGAYIYWWLRSQAMGGQKGDFWRSDEDAKWFKRKNPECAVRHRMRRARSGYNGLLEGTKYGNAREEAQTSA